MIYGIVLGISFIVYGLTSSYIPLLAGLVAMTVIGFYPRLSKLKSRVIKPKSKSATQNQAPKKKSWKTVKGLAITATVIAALVFLVILPIRASITRTKTVYYYPTADTQTICIGKKDQKVHFKVEKAYYEIPKFGRTLKNGTAVSTLGEWPSSEAKKLLLVKYRRYGEILLNNQPSNSVTKLDSDGCLEVKLNIPKVVKTIRGKKIVLQFTKL